MHPSGGCILVQTWRVQLGQIGLEVSVGHAGRDAWTEGGCMGLNSREEILEIPAPMQIEVVEVGEMLQGRASRGPEMKIQGSLGHSTPLTWARGAYSHSGSADTPLPSPLEPQPW